MRLHVFAHSLVGAGLREKSTTISANVDTTFFLRDHSRTLAARTGYSFPASRGKLVCNVSLVVVDKLAFVPSLGGNGRPAEIPSRRHRTRCQIVPASTCARKRAARPSTRTRLAQRREPGLPKYKGSLFRSSLPPVPLRPIPHKSGQRAWGGARPPHGAPRLNQILRRGSIETRKLRPKRSAF